MYEVGQKTYFFSIGRTSLEPEMDIFPVFVFCIYKGDAYKETNPDFRLKLHFKLTQLKCKSR